MSRVWLPGRRNEQSDICSERIQLHKIAAGQGPKVRAAARGPKIEAKDRAGFGFLGKGKGSEHPVHQGGCLGERCKQTP